MASWNGPVVPTERLKKRRDFLAARRGRRASTSDLALECLRRRTSAADAEPGTAELENVAPRIGITVTRRIGNAVTRNRVKRRIRAAIDAQPVDLFQAHHDYVVIARTAIVNARFADLIDGLADCVVRVHAPRRTSSRRKPARGRKPREETT